MFSRIRAFLNRHRRKFVVGGIILGGTVLLSRYVQRALRDWQERETKELLERTRKQQHYESIERTCNQTALTLAPNLKDTITKMIKTEELIFELKNGATNKLLVWEELKVLAFTKISVLVYASSMLMVTLRIQLNLIGGYMFRDTTEESAAATEHVSSSLQERYLCLCQHFISEGTRRLCTLIEQKVKLIIEDRSLKEKLTLQDIEQIFWAVQSSVSRDNDDPCKNLVSYILPDRFEMENLEDEQCRMLERMVLETRDLLESDEITSLTASCISRGFSHIMDQVADYFCPKETIAVAGCSTMPDVAPVSIDRSNFFNMNKVSIPLAKVIPIVNGLVHSQGNQSDMPHTWMQQLILMDILKVMGANVYETFCNKG